MITKNNSFAGANFQYTNESNCTATGEYRTENDKLVSININGQYVDGDVAYNFWANRDASGSVNISGVPASVLAPIAAQVAEIVAEVEALVEPAKEEE